MHILGLLWQNYVLTVTKYLSPTVCVMKKLPLCEYTVISKLLIILALKILFNGICPMNNNKLKHFGYYTDSPHLTIVLFTSNSVIK